SSGHSLLAFHSVTLNKRRPSEVVNSIIGLRMASSFQWWWCILIASNSCCTHIAAIALIAPIAAIDAGVRWQS
ncbi:hypothetical protein N5D66_08820, partial [Delftia tsuruhatensis]